MDTLEAFLLGCHTRSYKEGEVILMQNNFPTHAYAIKRGIAKSYSLTANGEEKSLAFSVQGEIFPFSWLFSKTERAVFYFQAYTDCEVYVIEKQAFLKLLTTTPNVAYYLLEKQVSTTIELFLQINALEQSRAHMKILAMFQYLCIRHGKMIAPGRVRIGIPFTQMGLANFTGLTRETTVTELQKLKEEKVLTSKRKLYTLNTELLANYLDDDFRHVTTNS